MSSASLPLKISLALVMLASATELSLVTSTVGYLALLSKRTLPATHNGTTVLVPGLPSHLEVNQGHTANGAAGTGLVVIGWAGVLALWLRSREGYHRSVASRALYRLWLALQVPALLLTLGALAYVLSVTRMHEGQVIDLDRVVAGGGGQYPLLVWTPQGWFEALAGLELESGSDRDGIVTHLGLARGWEWNLVPFFVVQLVHVALALADARRRRRGERGGYGGYVRKGFEQGPEAGVGFGGK